VLYPVLGGLGLARGDRALIAFFGPRGLSSLLLVLLAVFAGVPGSRELFAVACLVVLISVVLHGTGVGLLLRRYRMQAEGATETAREGPAAARAHARAGETGLRHRRRDQAEVSPVPERITLDELRALQKRGEPVVLVDARTDRSFRSDPRTAEGAVRIDPEEPVRDATKARLSRARDAGGLLRLTGRSDQRPGGAAAETGGMDEGARADRRLAGVAGRRAVRCGRPRTPSAHS
jgi:hypothetical protein